MDAFELIDRTTAADDIPPARFARYTHLQVLKIILLKQRDVFPI